MQRAVERGNVTIPRRVLHAIDQAAQRQHKSRSAYLAEAGRFFDRVPVLNSVLPAPQTRPARPVAKAARKAMKASA